MIYINDKIRIAKADDKNLQLEIYKDVKSKKAGELSKQWIWAGYYGDLESALMGVLKKQLFDTADEELKIKSLAQKIDEAKDEIRNLIKKL